MEDRGLALQVRQVNSIAFFKLDRLLDVAFEGRITVGIFVGNSVLDCLSQITPTSTQ